MKNKMYLIVCMTYLLLLTPLMSAPVYYKYSDRITNNFCSYMEKKHGLHCTANSGEFLYNVNKLHICFEGVKNLSIKDAREIIVDAMHELLERVNEDNDIKPYLSHHPFTEKDINLLISLCTPEGDRVSSKFISFIFTSRGTICYDIYNAKTELLETVREETYQKACDIIARRKSTASE